MTIKEILLKNFKLHHNLLFKFKKRNCLIYGENGSGKSSIYKALYTSLYDQKIRGRQIDFEGKYKHRDYSAEDMLVNIKFSSEDQLIRNNNSLENSNLISDQTVYCANERLLREISEHDFYHVINTILLEHFPAINSINKIYSTLSREIKRYNHTQQEKQDKEKIVTQRIECDDELKREIDTIIPVVKINKILKENLNEKFQIAFEVKDSSIDFSAIDIRLIYPKIKIRLKNISHRGELKDNFNEAKLKLISIAIYFSLAKQYETDSDLKILVLDDFLTSLDMANRKLIIQYILDDFKDYQKIIFTHNIQFYNLIIRLVNLRGEGDEWDIKNIFLRIENNQEFANIYTLHPNYLIRAEERLALNDLESTGNFLRKEFERIMSEFEQILAIGGKETLNNMIAALSKENQVFYGNPHEKLQEISKTVKKATGNAKQPDKAKLHQIELCIARLEENKISFKSADYNILREVEFYKNILLNPASHDNTEIDMYRKECRDTINLLKDLNNRLEHLKPSYLKAPKNS